MHVTDYASHHKTQRNTELTQRWQHAHESLTLVLSCSLSSPSLGRVAEGHSCRLTSADPSSATVTLRRTRLHISSPDFLPAHAGKLPVRPQHASLCREGPTLTGNVIVTLPKFSSGIRCSKVGPNTKSDSVNKSGFHMLHSPSPSNEDDDDSPSGRIHMVLPLQTLGQRKLRSPEGILGT